MPLAGDKMQHSTAIFISLHRDSLRQARAGWMKATELCKRGFHVEVFTLLEDPVERGGQDMDSAKDHIENLRAIMNTGDAASCPIHFQYDHKSKFRIALFFGWRAARHADQVSIAVKTLVLDDIEAWQHPMGDTFVAAEAAILRGLPVIALGQWVGRMARDVFGLKTFTCRVGTNIISPVNAGGLRRNALCVLTDPVSAQTCAHFASEALGIFNSTYPGVEILLVGSEIPGGQWYPCERIVTSLPQVRRRIFESCIVGLALSTVSQPGPALEMMACGLPVVNLYRDLNLHDYPATGLYLAHQAPESVAYALKLAVDAADRFNHVGLAEETAT